MYMSYCKFEGTRHELNACLNDVEEHIAEEAEYPISDREIREFKDLVVTFINFLFDNELITEDGELDDDQFNEICEAMAKGADDENL